MSLSIFCVYLSQFLSLNLTFSVLLCVCVAVFYLAIFHCDLPLSLLYHCMCVYLCIRVCVTLCVSISFYFSLCVCVSLCQSCVFVCVSPMDVLCLSHTTHTHTHRPKGLSLNHRENKAKYSGTLHLFRKKFSKVKPLKKSGGTFTLILLVQISR